MLAKAAKGGGVYARPGEVFSASQLEAIKTGVSPYNGSASVGHRKRQEGRCDCACDDFAASASACAGDCSDGFTCPH
jgi:hypothetical protein